MADIFKTHKNRNILTDAAYAAGEYPMEYRSDIKQQSRVCVGARQFNLANFRHKAEDKVLIAAHDRDYITARVISGDDWKDFEDKADIDYRRHPDPWGDANALEQMTRHWLDVDSGSLPRKAMREYDYGWPSIEPKAAPKPKGYFAALTPQDEPNAHVQPVFGTGRTREEALANGKESVDWGTPLEVFPCTKRLYEAVEENGGDLAWEFLRDSGKVATYEEFEESFTETTAPVQDKPTFKGKPVKTGARAAYQAAQVKAAPVKTRRQAKGDEAR